MSCRAPARACRESRPRRGQPEAAGSPESVTDKLLEPGEDVPVEQAQVIGIDLGTTNSLVAFEATARHLSFIETGRAQPSRDMVLLLARVLEVPPRAKNELLTAAGFAALAEAASQEV